MALNKIFSAAIAHGPETPGNVGGTIMIVLGLFFTAMSLGSQTRVGAAFMHGKGKTQLINPAGRVILFAVAFVLIIMGLQGLFR
jgi:hypothetical protein